MDELEQRTSCEDPAVDAIHDTVTTAVDQQWISKSGD